MEFRRKVVGGRSGRSKGVAKGRDGSGKVDGLEDKVGEADKGKGKVVVHGAVFKARGLRKVVRKCQNGYQNNEIMVKNSQNSMTNMENGQ